MPSFGGDRAGGGRESKSYDRRTKRILAAKANPFTGKDKVYAIPALAESPAAPPVAAAKHARSLIDAGANLISRQLSREHGRMLSRAQSEHVDAIISFVTDWDRVDELAALVRANPGFLYAAIGVHPDNVKRSDSKLFTQKVSQLKSLALTPFCVALYGGFDHTRDIASQFPQQKLLQEQLALGSEIHLPVLIHVIGSGDRILEILTEFNETHAASASSFSSASSAVGGAGEAASSSSPWTPKHCIMPFDGNETQLNGYLELGCWIALDGAVCDPVSEEGERLRSLVAKIPLSKLLLASNSPLHTPQSIPDHIVKSSRNEPSNMPAVLPVILDAYNAVIKANLAGTPVMMEDGTPFVPAAEVAALKEPLTLDQLARILYENSVAFFQLSGEDFVAEAAAGAGAGGDKRKGKGKASAAGPSAGGAGAEGDEEHEHDEEGEDEEDEDEEEEGEEEGDAVAELPSAKASKRGGGGLTALRTGVAPVSIEYRCRTCRFPLFTDDDIMPHDGRSIKPSNRTLANLKAEEQEEAARALEAAAKKASDELKKKGQQQKQPPAAAAGGKGGKRRKGGRGDDSDEDEHEDAAKSAAAGGADEKKLSRKDRKAQRQQKQQQLKKAGGKKGGFGALAAADDEDDDSHGDSEKEDEEEEGEHGDDESDGGSEYDGGDKHSVGADDGEGGGGRTTDEDEDDEDDEDGEGEDGIGELPSAAKSKPAAAALATSGVPKALKKFGDGATVIDIGEGLTEVSVGRWHTAKGRTVKADDGVCRMMLIDNMTWMEHSPDEPDGNLCCPGCRNKIGVYSLGGLKCSCGLAVAPAFKIPKDRVDAVLHGVDVLEAALAAASMEERGADLGGLVAALNSAEAAALADEDTYGKEKLKKESGLKVPVVNYRGNFSNYRSEQQKITKVKRSADKKTAVSGAGAAGAAGAGAGAGAGASEEDTGATPASSTATPSAAASAKPSAAGGKAAAKGKKEGKEAKEGKEGKESKEALEPMPKGKKNKKGRRGRGADSDDSD